MAVAIGKARPSHGRIMVDIGQQATCFLEQPMAGCANEQHAPGGDGFGAFGGLAGDEHRAAEGRGLLLDTAAVGDDKIRGGEQCDKLGVIGRRSQDNAGAIGEEFAHGGEHVGIEMHRIDEQEIGVLLG